MIFLEGFYMVQYPADFLWGVACASYQCEGAWNEDGKGPNIWDDFCHEHRGHHIKNGDSGDIACDAYHRFREDIALMKAHHIQAYRFSISWARVIPDGDGEINEKGLQYYSDLVDELLKNGIEPLITLYHWDLPSALQMKGGWLNRDIIPAFGRYARVIAQAFQGRVRTYMTINEPQCITYLGYGSGVHAPGWKLGDEYLARIYHIICLAHSEAQRQIKAVSPDARVGIVPCGNLCYPQHDTPQGRRAAYRATFEMAEDDWAFYFNIVLDSLILRRYDSSIPEAVRRFAATIPAQDWQAMEKPDFIGINVYHGTMVDDQGKPTGRYPGFPVTACKWDVTPEVMHYGPLNLCERYHLPMIISENGLSCQDVICLDGKVHDPQRIDFLHRYLTELLKAIEEGAPVQAYLQWSFLDNFEWNSGYDERFGLVYVDYPSLRRVPKDSLAFFSQVIASRGGCLNTP